MSLLRKFRVCLDTINLQYLGTYSFDIFLELLIMLHICHVAFLKVRNIVENSTYILIWQSYVQAQGYFGKAVGLETRLLHDCSKQVLPLGTINYVIPGASPISFAIYRLTRFLELYRFMKVGDKKVSMTNKFLIFFTNQCLGLNRMRKYETSSTKRCCVRFIVNPFKLGWIGGAVQQINHKWILHYRF